MNLIYGDFASYSKKATCCSTDIFKAKTLLNLEFSSHYFFVSLVPSLPPQIIKLQNSSSTSISVQWKPVPKDYVHGILLGIKLVYRSASRDNSIVFSSLARHAIEEDWSNYTVITVPPNTLSYEMTSLKKFTNYSVVILGFTSKGDGNVSHQFIVSTDEDGQYDGVENCQMFALFNGYNHWLHQT